MTTSERQHTERDRTRAEFQETADRRGRGFARLIPVGDYLDLLDQLEHTERERTKALDEADRHFRELNRERQTRQQAEQERDEARDLARKLRRHTDNTWVVSLAAWETE